MYPYETKIARYPGTERPRTPLAYIAAGSQYSNQGTYWIRVAGKDFAEVVPNYRFPVAPIPVWPDSVPVYRATQEEA